MPQIAEIKEDEDGRLWVCLGHILKDYIQQPISVYDADELKRLRREWEKEIIARYERFTYDLGREIYK